MPIPREDASRQHTAAARDFQAAYELIAATMSGADLGRYIGGLEL